MPYTEADFTRIPATGDPRPKVKPAHINQFIDTFKLTPKVSEVLTDATLTVATGGVPTWLRTQGTVNVENHGVRTTNTATQNAGALNALAADIKAGNIAERRVFLPNLYDIDASILVDQGRIELFGAGPETSGLEQQTANIPAMVWDNESGDGGTPGDQMTSIHLHHFALRHAAQADGADTDQFGIRLRPSPDGSSPGAWNGYGWYLNAFEDLEFRNCYKGFGVDPDAAVKGTVWCTTFRNLTFWDTKYSAIYINDGGISGMPNNVFDNTNILNYGMRRGDGGGNYATGPAIDLTGNHSGLINGLNIEDWVDRAVLFNSCDGLVTNVLRTERHDIRTDVISVVDFEDCESATLNGYNNQLMRLNQPVYAFLLNAAAGTTVTINGLAATRDSGSGTDVTAALWGDPATSRITLNGSSLSAVPGAGTGGSLQETLESTWGTGLYVVESRNGHAPIWNTQPTAAAQYLARNVIVRTAGVDTLSVCRQTASTPTYAWTALH